MDNMLALSKSNEREVPELSDILVPHPYLETNGVRIMPKMLMLANPFEGKIFRETITIRNCGRNPAFIRVLPASSSVSTQKPNKPNLKYTLFRVFT